LPEWPSARLPLPHRPRSSAPCYTTAYRASSRAVHPRKPRAALICGPEIICAFSFPPMTLGNMREETETSEIKHTKLRELIFIPADEDCDDRRAD
jgi:hypothetical protein